jgi:hypothetical protein
MAAQFVYTKPRRSSSIQTGYWVENFLLHVRRARKNYDCVECGGQIQKGELHAALGAWSDHYHVQCTVPDPVRYFVPCENA